MSKFDARAEAHKHRGTYALCWAHESEGVSAGIHGPSCDEMTDMIQRAFEAGQATQAALREALIALAGRIERGEPARVGEGWADELRALAATPRKPTRKPRPTKKGPTR